MPPNPSPLVVRGGKQATVVSSRMSNRIPEPNNFSWQKNYDREAFITVEHGAHTQRKGSLFKFKGIPLKMALLREIQ
jgi:hypothetical protein